ncbi:formylglycine-generating enzyme family protein [Chryseosolibacter histidini]|uniref:formylglycine-generating enzyme family protein n=1 Tax=Chryseosolibacter histidini TaxID=2782349 RepID=UPI0020B2823C|nr:SUMF1/EgtB/PvdO family nonheme iron enzyme [Chryseosolibacter histidini]
MRTFVTIFFLALATALSAQETKPYEQTITGTAVKFKMVPIPAGSFTIGSPASEKGRDADEGPQKKVTVSAFWMGEREVTFGEWDTFFKNMDVPQTKSIEVDAVSRPTAQYIDLTWGMGRDAKQPTNSMSQQAAIMYCKWLYEKTGVFYRLPTEAEWEYACRAGSGPDLKNLTAIGYFKGNSQDKFHKTAELKPNAWGLYDMLGNVSEWTLDQYDPAAYQKLADGAKDPVVPPASKYPKVVRGGSYMDESVELRCANRIASDASWNVRDPQIPKSKWWLTDGMFVGFRIVRPGQQPSKEAIEKFFNSYLK